MRRIEVSRETSDRLALYVDMLKHWNERIRLTGLSDALTVASLQDSLELWTYAPPRVTAALDIGSGNGLPALPLSIAFQIPYLLVEADRRKAAFLREVARELACPVTVAAQRIEDMPECTFDLITARAFARLPRLLDLAYPRQTRGTTCLFPKGPTADVEVDEARRDWLFDCIFEPASSGCVLRISSIRRRQ